jgi:hypothetical protein
VEDNVAGDTPIRLGVLLTPARSLLARSIEMVLGLQPDFAIVAVDPGSPPGSHLLLVDGAEVVIVDDVSLIAVLLESRPDLKVIVLDAAGDPNTTLASIRAGAAACISETSSPWGDEPGQMTLAMGRRGSSPTSWPRLRRGAWNTTQRDRDRGLEGCIWDTPSPVHQS